MAPSHDERDAGGASPEGRRASELLQNGVHSSWAERQSAAAQLRFEKRMSAPGGDFARAEATSASALDAAATGFAASEQVHTNGVAPLSDSRSERSASTDGRISVAMIGTRGLPASDGGAEKGVEGLALALARRGHSVTVYGRLGYCDSRLRTYKGVRQIPLGQIRTKHLEAITHTALATAHALVVDRSYDVIHFHATGPALLSLVPRSLDIPTVATIQGMDWKREKWGRAAKSVLRLAARVASTVPDETIVVSRVLQELVQEAYGQQTHYIPNGVELPESTALGGFEGIGEVPFVLFLARLVPEKQVHVLIDAFKRVRGDVQLVIAGSSSHSNAYAVQIHELAARDPRIKVVGSRYGAEKAWLLRNAAVFVQPSTIEGLPIALLEALSCDRLTVVSDIPENVETVTLQDRPHGLVFRTGDAVDLAEKIQQALTSGHGAQLRTPGVGDLVRERYDWDRIAEQTENVYRRAVDKRRRRSIPHPVRDIRELPAS
jgi:glycosyltransferase involved in cell wall biosynthesis